MRSEASVAYGGEEVIVLGQPEFPPDGLDELGSKDHRGFVPEPSGFLLHLLAAAFDVVLALGALEP